MNALLVMLYLALCVLLFLICRLPFNRWTAPVAVLGGILLTAGPIIVMDLYHPYSSTARPQAKVLPIVAPVAGTVVKIAVEENQAVRRGELLFNIDPEPFQLEVQALEASVEQARSSLQQAPAGAARDLAQARLSELQAQLAHSLYRLGQTSVRAPADGRVVNLGIVTGHFFDAAPAQPVLHLVDADPTAVVAWIAPNRVAAVEPGAPAEVAFDAIPGRVFAAEVARVSSAADASAGPRVAVQLRITDPGFDASTPTGAAQAAVYGKRLPEIAIMRKLLLRMSSWIDFVHPYG